MNLLGNPINQSGLKAQVFYDAVVTSLQRWQAASSGQVGFDYWQGSNRQIYPNNSELNGISSLYFDSSTSSDSHLSPIVLGMTQVWYNTTSGEILETDIVLNDRDFIFTNNPTDTSGYGAGPSVNTDGKKHIYIQNVITHELGHALGLSHSAGLQSTMLFTESPEQAHLSCDEMIGIHDLYPSSDSARRGALTGRVLSPAGSPLLGAHIVAISAQRGTVLATALTDKSGSYSIGALEPGNYYLLVEPFYAGSQALPLYYSDLNASVCPNGFLFSRTFLTENRDGFTLQKIGVQSQRLESVPDIVVSCNHSGGASAPGNTTSSSQSQAPIINLQVGNHGDIGIIDNFISVNTNYYRLIGISGHLEAHAIGYGLYSPIHPVISLLDSEGKVVATQKLDPVYAGDSGFVNRDTAIIADDLPPDNYLLTVTENHLQSWNYPGGSVALDSIPFVVVTASLNTSSPPLESTLPNNARCRSPEIFPQYTSPPKPPPFSNQLNTDGMGSCGILQTDRHRRETETQEDDQTHSLVSQGCILVGWLIPWLFMGLVSRLTLDKH